jgi:ubiquinone/menaquinone biosynthesis C-methylase UbiE
MALDPGGHVQDVACGLGMSAIHLADCFGCQVTGLDYGAESIDAARSLAVKKGVADLTAFQKGDAEGLPFANGSLDAVISECSFCTFPDKTTAAAEMARVLRSGGRLGLTDMTVSGTLSDDLRTVLSWVACVAGAGRVDDYVATLRSAGFADFVVEDHGDALLDMVMDVCRKMLGVELAVKLGKIELDGLDLEEGKRLARRAEEWTKNGSIGYVLVTARRI